MSEPDVHEIIRVEDLECRFDDLVILRDVSFAVASREIFFVAGRSGCGKTTLLRHLVGLLCPFRGHVAYFGRDFTGASPVDRRDLTRSFGVLFQNNALWADMTLLENLALPLVLHTKLPRETRNEIVALKLAQVGLAGCQDRYPRELSGGMQKRAALGRALAENLRAAPAIREVLTDQPARQDEAIYTLSIRVLACEGRLSGAQESTAFEASWEVTIPDPRGEILAHGVFRARPASWSNGNYGELALHLSRALEDFSAVLLSALAHPPASGTTNSLHAVPGTV